MNRDGFTLIMRAVECWQDRRGVRRFAAAMRRRLRDQRRAGRGGWWHPHVCSPQWFREHILTNNAKGHYVDVANLAMMAWNKYTRPQGTP